MIREIAITTALRCYSRARDFVDETWRDLESAFVNQIKEDLRLEIQAELGEQIHRRVEARVTKDVARFLRESVSQTGAGYAALLENGNWKNQALPNRAGKVRSIEEYVNKVVDEVNLTPQCAKDDWYL